MSEFNFKSQKSTTREQSKRLLSLGLKRETADMSYTAIVVNHKVDYRLDCSTPKSIDIPAWSLHRLIEIMPTLIRWKDKQYWLDVNNDGVCYSTSMSHALVELIADNLYDNIIDCIEWLINEGHFPKEYLV